MKLKSFFKKLFLGGEVLEKTDSLVNREIRVIEDIFGQKELVVGGIAQSGGLVKKLWEKEVKNLKKLNVSFKNCLILGLGAGSLAQALVKTFPGIEILGVEIDPQIIYLGKKYFALGEIPRLKIVTGDAVALVKKNLPEPGFDLLIIDLYCGQKPPSGAETEAFLRGTKNHLRPGGVAIFNRLYFNRWHQEQTKAFLARLKNFYSKLKAKKSFTNLLIFAFVEAKNKV